MLKTMYVWTIRLLMLVWWLFLALMVTKFYLDNTEVVSIHFMRWTLSEVSVSTLAFALLGGGMGLAIFILLPWVFMLRLKTKRLEKQLSRTTTALNSVAKV